jgi:hypothetical protein
MALLTSLIGAGGGGGGSSTLTGLTDTNISSPLDTETLTYHSSSGKWINATASASVATLNNVGNVTITSIASDEIIKWNGSAWVNNTLAEAGIAAASHTHAASDVTSGTLADGRIAESNVTQHEAAIDHDALTNFVANEHIDWTGASANFSTTGTGALGGDLTMYEATNDGNPEIRLGSADAEELHIQTVYNTGAQTMDYVLFQTDVASAAADKGLFRFNVDGTDILDIDDGGLELTGSITVSGTVDGRDIATDGTKLDGIEASADVTDYTNVEAALNGGTITSATVATGDKVLIQDIDDSDNLKVVTAQSIADLNSGMNDVVDDTTPQLGGNLDVNGNEIQSVSAGDIVLHSDNDVNLILGDDAGVDDVNIKDSGSVNVCSINSDGQITTLGGIVMSDTNISGVNNITFTDTAGQIAGIQNQNLVDKTAAATITGAWNFGGATTLEIPNSATPSVTVDGQVAIDTTVTDFSHGVMKYYGGEEMAVVAMPIAELTSPTDGHVVAYNATNDEFELVEAAGGGGGDSAMQLGALSQADVADVAVALVPGGFDSFTTEGLSTLAGTGDMYFFPGYIPETRTYNDFGVEVSTAGDAGDEIEFIIYSVGSDNLPNTKLWESGSIDISSTGVKTVAADQSFTQGMVWIGLLVDVNNTGAALLRAHNNIDGAVMRHFIEVYLGPSQTQIGLKDNNNTYAIGGAPTAPSSLTRSGSQEDPPIVWLTVD